MDDYLATLVRLSADAPAAAGSPEATAALQRLDAEIAQIAPSLAVECYGPAVGLDGAPTAYRLVIRPHEWRPNHPEWSLKVCAATPQGQWRAAWAVQGTGRRRKALILRVLPELLADYAAAVSAAGKDLAPAACRVREMAERLAGAASVHAG